jgi:hypothetical protein
MAVLGVPNLVIPAMRALLGEQFLLGVSLVVIADGAEEPVVVVIQASMALGATGRLGADLFVMAGTGAEGVFVTVPAKAVWTRHGYKIPQSLIFVNFPGDLILMGTGDFLCRIPL